MPMVVLVAPVSLSHACSALSVIWLGKPKGRRGWGSRASWGSRAPGESRGGPRPMLRSKIVIHGQRRVIGETSSLVYGGGAGLAGQRAAHDLVVDAPADVVGARLSAVGPPGVQLRLRSHLAERIHVASRTEQLVHPGALLGQETGVLLVGAPVAQVDRLVGDVPVTAEDVVTPPPLETCQMRLEGLQEAVLGGLALRARGAGRQVQRNHRQLADLHLEVAALAVELIHPEAAQHAIGLVARVERNPGITPALGVAEVAVVARHPDVVLGELVFLAVGLLQADEVILLSAQPP